MKPPLLPAAALLLAFSPYTYMGRAAAPDRGEKAGTPEAAATVVVFNRNDPASVTLAAAYASKRGVPFDRLVGLDCPKEETITRAQYDETIAGPLRKIFTDRGWWRLEAYPGRLGDMRVEESSLRYVALIRGVPLRIAAEAQAYPGDRPEALPPALRRNEAAVDSELALLGRGFRQISGAVDNPFYRSTARPDKTAFPPGLLLVCRLDAATPGTVQRMITDAEAVERNGLRGFAYIDSRRITSGGYAEGDEWLRAVANDTFREGFPTIHEDTPELFAQGYPMSRAALYFGWYAEHVCGPFKNPGFRFVPGAVAVHIHSFSATTLRDPQKQWCAPLLELGAAATLGNVYEPYLHLTPHLDIFEARLRDGFNFAEAAYAAQPALSWMTTFIGDPLYRPFKALAGNGAPKGATKDTTKSTSAAEYAAYREGARLWYAKKRSAGESALMAKGAALKSGIIFEGLAALQLSVRDPGAATESLRQARRYYSQEEDRARCALHLAGLLFNMGKKNEAMALVNEELKADPNGVAAPLLRNLVARLTAPPPGQAPQGGQAKAKP